MSLYSSRSKPRAHSMSVIVTSIAAILVVAVWLLSFQLGTTDMTEFQKVHWTLDEGAGVAVVDVEGAYPQSMQGNFVGGVSWVNDPEMGQVLEFDGTGRVDVPAKGQYRFDHNSFTISAWIKTTKTKVGILSLSDGDGKFETGEKVFHIVDGKDHAHEKPVGSLSFNCRGDEPITGGKADGDEHNLTDNQWHHVAVSYERATSRRMVFIDGKLVWNTYDSYVGGADNANHMLRLGWSSVTRTWGGGIHKYFKGRMADVRVFDHGLSPLRVKQLYRLRKQRLLSWWKLNEIVGGETVDVFNSRDLSVNSASPEAAAKLSGGLRFGGTGSLDLSDANYLNGHDEMTVAMWVKADQLANQSSDQIVFKASGTSEISLGFKAAGLNSEGNVLAGRVGSNIAETPGDQQSTDWQHVALTWKSGETVKLYVNGSNVATNYQTAVIIGETSGISTLAIGEQFAGAIDDVRVYAKSLSDGAIELMAKNQLPTAYAGDDTTATSLLATQIDAIADDTAVSLYSTVEDDIYPVDGTLEVDWTVVAMPLPESKVLISNRDTVNPVMSFYDPGEYELYLEVSDGDLLTTDSITITVEAGEVLTLPGDGTNSGQGGTAETDETGDKVNGVLVSPAFVEGTYAFSGSPSVVAEGYGAPVPGFDLDENRYFVNVPLDPSGDVTPVTFTLDLLEERTGKLRWKTLDIAGMNANDNQIVIRKNDSLLLTSGEASDGTTFEVDHDGDGVFEGPFQAGDKVPTLFAETGSFSMSLKVDGLAVGTYKVRVVDAEIDRTACEIGFERKKLVNQTHANETTWVQTDIRNLDLELDPMSLPFMVAIWDFESPDDLVAEDQSDYDHHGTLQGGAQQIAADEDSVDGGYLRLNGGSGKVTTGKVATWSNQVVKSRVVSLYFNADDINKTSRQFLYEEGGSIRGVSIYLENGQLVFGGWNDRNNESGWKGTWLSVSLADHGVTSGSWHEVKLVLDGGSSVTPDALKGYLDGELVASGNGSQLWQHDPASIGGVTSNTLTPQGVVSSGSFSGKIDKVRVQSQLDGQATWLHVRPSRPNVTPCITARINGSTGPIMNFIKVDEFTLTDTGSNTIEVIEVYPDGSVMVEASLIIDPAMIPELDLKFWIQHSWVTLDDGTLVRWLNIQDDFGDDGTYVYRLINSPQKKNVCHTFRAQQDGVWVSRSR